MPRERDRAQADRADPLHQHAIAGANARALDDVDRGEQAAAAADVGAAVDDAGSGAMPTPGSR